MNAPLIGLLALGGGVFLRWSPLWGGALLLATILFTLFTSTSRVRRLTLLGMALVTIAGYLGSAPTPVAQLDEVPMRFKGQVIEDPRKSQHGYRLLVDIDETAGAIPDAPWQAASERILLSLRGEPDQPPAKGDTVIFRSRLFRPDGFRNPGTLWHSLYLARKKITARAWAKWPGTAIFTPAPQSRWGVDTFRGEISAAIERASPGQGGAVVRALALGDRSSIESKTMESFRRAGTAHLLSISGLHLGIIAMISTLLLFPLLARMRPLTLRIPAGQLVWFASLPLVWGYAYLTGMGSGTVRALIMTSLVVTGIGLGRRASAPGLLCATGFAMALVAPLYLTDPGLHLSLAALTGIFYLSPTFKLNKRAPDDFAFLPPPLYRRALNLLARTSGGWVRTAIAATLCTAPVAAFHFGNATLAGIVFNPLAVPVIGFVALPLSVAGVVLHPLLPALSVPLWQGGAQLVEMVLRLQGGALEIYQPVSGSLDSIWTFCGVILLLAGWVLHRRKSPHTLKAIVAGALLLILPSPLTHAYHALDNRVHGWVLDVGDGQAVALRLPGPVNILIDGGGMPGSKFDVGASIVLPALHELGMDKLDLVISTHPHPDHLEGLVSLSRVMEIGEIWLPTNFRGDLRYAKLLETIAAAGTDMRWVEDVRSVTFDPATISVIQTDGPVENDRGLVTRVEYGGHSILIPADLERTGQELLLDNPWLGHADIMVAPHHGGADAVYQPFTDKVAPRRVVVSCGDRRALPSDEFIQSVDQIGAEQLSTTVSGAIHMVLTTEKAYVEAANR